MSFTNNLASIAINKSVLKKYKTREHDNVVYMNDGDEFQICLFNPETCVIGASISINGKSFGNKIVLKPGERIWLERFLDSNNKFKFSTYTVDNCKEVKDAIKKNGNIVISFYREVSYSSSNTNIIINGPLTSTPIPTKPYDVWCTSNINSITSGNSLLNNITGSYTDTELSLSTSGVVSASAASTLYSNVEVNSAKQTTSIETGRVEKGSYSNQTFNKVNTDFEYYAFATEMIKILPMSQKPYTANDIKKIYCVECGKRLNPKYKFCPSCGHKVELV